MLFLLLAPVLAVAAEDEQRVTSPDGALEFRLFINQPEPGGLPRLAYQVFFHAKPLIDTSYLGLEIYNQEPVLGENDGLTAARTGADGGNRYHSLMAAYMQNGSLGRRINVEARVYNSGVAFRYVVPPSTPLDDLAIEDEATEFDLAEGIDPIARIDLPFVVEQPGMGWVEIAEAGRGSYPAMHLMRFEGNILITRLARRADNPNLAFEGQPPLTCPWRVVLVARDRESLRRGELLEELSR